MPAYMLVAELILETKGLLQASTIFQVRDMLVHAGFQGTFDRFISPLLRTDTGLDIPSVDEIRRSVVPAYQSELARDKYTLVPVGINNENLADRVTALVLHIAEYIANEKSCPGAAVTSAWIITKLMVAMFRYQELYLAGGWDDYAQLDGDDGEEDEEEEEEEYGTEE